MNRIKDLREDRDIKQTDIASHLHIAQNTYSQYENGQRQMPLSALIGVAQYFHVPVDYLLGLTDCMQPYPPREERE